MFNSRYTISTILLLIILSLTLTGAATIKWKPLTFENPGSKRLVKASSGNYYYFRSLPEETLMLKVKDLTAIEIKAVSKIKVSSPQFILKYEGKRVTYDLKTLALSEKFHVFEPVKIALPPGLTQVELLCYDRNIYFRAFMPVTVQAKKAKVPTLKLNGTYRAHEVSGTSSKHNYYAFMESTPFSYQVRAGLAHTVYVRAELTSKDRPMFGLYENAKLIRKYEFALKRSNSYKTEGINHLTIGRKLDFPVQDKTKTYELRALTDHLFLARPLIRKAK